MLTSLALIFLVGLAAAALCARIGLPRIIGMLLAGMLLGPYVLGLLDPSILSISADLRRMALVIILIKAGLSLSIDDLRKIGRPALLMSFLPALFELLAVVLLAPRIFGVTVLEAAILGAVLSAVSPAVVVPRMVALIEEKRGTGKAIPQLILAGASLDDVVCHRPVFLLHDHGAGRTRWCFRIAGDSRFHGIRHAARHADRRFACMVLCLPACSRQGHPQQREGHSPARRFLSASGCGGST